MENPDTTPDENKRKQKERRNLIFAILSLLVCVTIPIAAIFGAQSSFGKLNDFPEYYAAAKMICSGDGAAIYKLDELFKVEHQHFPNMEGRGVGYYIPPFASPLLAWLGLLPAQSSYLAFMLASIAALVLSVLFSSKHFKLSHSSSIWLATALCASGPVFESMKIAQLAPFLFLSLSLFLFLSGRNKDILAGMGLSLLLLKPQELMPIALYLLFARRWKIVAGLLVVAALSAAASLLMLQAQGYINYFDLLKDSAANTQFMQPELGATVRGQLLRLIPDSANAISAATLACNSIYIAFIGFKFGKSINFENALLFSVLPLGLATTLHCHDYDLLLLSPWLLALLDPSVERERPRTAGGSPAHTSINSPFLTMTRILACLFLLTLAVPVYIPIHYDWLLRDKQPLNPIFLLLVASSIASATFFLQAALRPPKDEP